ncbi:hypothetical protein P280DRAFT_414005, partial [Massarina eburnea CBS 473.64]
IKDTIGLTLFALPNSKENIKRLVYSQCYAIIKTLFDLSKQYVFSNKALKNLALDLGYVRSLYAAGRGKNFLKAVYKFSYLYSKQRAYANLKAN